MKMLVLSLYSQHFCQFYQFVLWTHLAFSQYNTQMAMSPKSKSFRKKKSVLENIFIPSLGCQKKNNIQWSSSSQFETPLPLKRTANYEMNY